MMHMASELRAAAIRRREVVPRVEITLSPDEGGRRVESRKYLHGCSCRPWGGRQACVKQAGPHGLLASGSQRALDVGPKAPSL